jgi:NTE family protein
LIRRTLLACALAALSACAFGPVQPPAPVTMPTTPTPMPTPDPIPVPVPVVKPPPKPPRLGLALGGGAARGFAHIGVIQVLEENGIKVDLVAGTSAGSLVAALYASGKGGKEMQALAEGMDEGAITDWSFPLRGLIRGEALARFIRDKTGGKGIEQMVVPLGIVATDLSDGSPILFRSGDTGTAVRASSAVPAVFQPVKIGQREYVDGGLVSPVPVRFAREMGAQLIVAVDITSPPEKDPPGDAFRMLMQTFSIMGRSINSFELRDADVLVRPRLDGVASGDFTARRRAIQAGRDAALAVLPLIRQRIVEKTR